jgi:hypothetical protein
MWEYKCIKVGTGGWTGGRLDAPALEAELNALGSQGWEVTAAFDTNQGQGATRDVIVFLERPIVT